VPLLSMLTVWFSGANAGVLVESHGPGSLQRVIEARELTCAVEKGWAETERRCSRERWLRLAPWLDKEMS